jgi:hypothetical protein
MKLREPCSTLTPPTPAPNFLFFFSIIFSSSVLTLSLHKPKKNKKKNKPCIRIIHDIITILSLRFHKPKKKKRKKKKKSLVLESSMIDLVLQSYAHSLTQQALMDYSRPTLDEDDGDQHTQHF